MSVDVLVGSFGAHGHEGVAAGLMAMIVGQGAFNLSTGELNVASVKSLLHNGPS